MGGVEEEAVRGCKAVRFSAQKIWQCVCILRGAHVLFEHAKGSPEDLL